jgi:hypothetical protein
VAVRRPGRRQRLAVERISHFVESCLRSGAA